jgi:hypothetical protein
MDLFNIAITKKLIYNRNLCLYPDGPLNPIRQLIVTQDTFTTIPTNLSNGTDGNLSNPTGTGSKTTSGSGTVGQFVLDLGNSKNVMVLGKIGLWSSTANMYCYVESSADGTTWNNPGQSYQVSGQSTSEVIKFVNRYVSDRYLRLRITVDAATTGNVKLYNLAAIEMPIVGV